MEAEERFPGRGVLLLDSASAVGPEGGPEGWCAIAACVHSPALSGWGGRGGEEK